MRTSAEREVIIFKNISALSLFVTEKWLELSEEAIAQKGIFTLALSGGKTPATLYKIMAGSSGRFQWEKTHIFFADERFVPHEHKESNYGMVKSILLDHIDIPPQNIHPVPITRDVRSSAMQYENELVSFFSHEPGTLPCFDLILLGIGKDGHTASLFPGEPFFHYSGNLAAAVDAEGHSARTRITLTLPVINNSGRIYFMVTGDDKAEVIRQIIEEKDSGLPASGVRTRKGMPLFLLDEGAAGRLSENIKR
ncbi:MAG: 6-phosphogluconolactonase [Nitrospirae bacterium]|nr:6-phosphogluconolactonase [Nitrospirota bacterium]